MDVVWGGVGGREIGWGGRGVWKRFKLSVIEIHSTSQCSYIDAEALIHMHVQIHTCARAQALTHPHTSLFSKNVASSIISCVNACQPYLPVDSRESSACNEGIPHDE